MRPSDRDVTAQVGASTEGGQKSGVDDRRDVKCEYFAQIKEKQKKFHMIGCDKKQKNHTDPALFAKGGE
ncbi:MAG: hypothetical protein ACI4SV_00495 [Duodenibacillus sp.]